MRRLASTPANGWCLCGVPNIGDVAGEQRLNAIEGAFHLAQASMDHARRVDPNSTILPFHCADADRLHRHSLR